LVPEILTFFINHVQKFKCPVKRMRYAKVDCSSLNADAKGLKYATLIKSGYKLFLIKVKVKGTLVRALKLCKGRTAHRGSRGIALLFYDHGTRRG
jgi:hypothetical protein